MSGLVALGAGIAALTGIGGGIGIGIATGKATAVSYTHLDVYKRQVLLAIFCNVLWGSAFPFIKLGYRLFSIDSGNTASIFCFAGVRFMLGSVLVLLGSILLQGKAPRLPRGRVAAVSYTHLANRIIRPAYKYLGVRQKYKPIEER